jgi:hydroxypyruvate reductase/glycerate 2-kinase
MNSKIIAEKIFLAGVESVSPDKLIRRSVSINGNMLFISDFSISLNLINQIFVIGAGKASGGMAKELESILGNRINGGHIIVKYGHGNKLKYINISEAGHPVPDSNGLDVTKKIRSLLNETRNDDLVICLLSGGGSALLTDLPEGATIEDMVKINNLLLSSGADIKEINTVRKHLSKIKGGQLAKAASPAILVNLILSDVVGDPVDVIASGPTVPDTTTFGDAIAILKKYNLLKKIPTPLKDYLQKGAEGGYPETPKPGDPIFSTTQNFIIGNNKMAMEAAFRKAMEFGLNPLIIDSALEGDTTKTAEDIVAIAIRFQNDVTVKKPCCLLFGGETTLKIEGNGIGGRNQHLALYAAWLLRDKEKITLLSAGTDGSDGPTKAAGAVVNTHTFDTAYSKGLDIKKYLENFDSFHFFEIAGGLVITGPTLTNVMDIIIVIVE